ncbi:MAG: FMN-binding negative transcriptional regulator [Alphaproteobacteria bacterium]|nr:FMN-binding negative transcriptional regulator [Alphaproteobacteria bacterium]
MSEMPRHYQAPYARMTSQEEVLRFARARAFATIVAVEQDAPLIAHAPVIWVDGSFRFHLARGNPVLSHAEAGGRLTLIFAGPDAYISPDWYESADMVPTWNYVRAIAAGRSRMLSREELRSQIDGLSAIQEEALRPKAPWTSAKMTPARLEALLGGIGGVSVEAEEVTGIAKLSQNRTEADRAGAIAGLRRRGDALSLAIAEAMERGGAISS